jgi:hypothetical protein
MGIKNLLSPRGEDEGEGENIFYLASPLQGEGRYN